MFSYSKPPRRFVSIYQDDALTVKGRANTIRAGNRKRSALYRWQDASFQSLNRHESSRGTGPCL